MAIKKQPEEIQLVFTRPFSLFTAEYWRYPLLLRNLRKNLGIRMKDQITHFDGRTQYFYRTTSDVTTLKQGLLSIRPGHRVHSMKACAEYAKAVTALRVLMEQTHSNKVLWTVYRKALQTIEKLYSWYVIGVFLPGQWADDYRSRYGMAGSEIVRRHYINRKTSEGLLGEFSSFINTIVRQRLRALGIPIDPSVLRRLEIERLLLSSVKPPAEVSKRRNGYVHIGGRLLVGIPFQKALRQAGYSYHPTVVGAKKIIKGTVAFKARPITGIVRLVLSPKDINRFKPGEILVTPMTQPDFLPAMRLSKAIVTDEGGVTCHAAIVSRELKIPCVIGTKIATKALRDGDIIEVDSNSGSIKKISK